MPSGVYQRKLGVKRGPYHRSKGKQHRKPRPKKALAQQEVLAPEYLTRSIAEAFESYREQGIDLLPPEIREKVIRIKARRKETHE